jgi:hypothetical protein
MRAVFLVALTVVLCASTGWSQQPDQSTKGAVIKGRAPVSEQVLQVKPSSQTASTLWCSKIIGLRPFLSS